MSKETVKKEKILIIGSGPIKIGQACEFDYSGTQACKALKDKGYEVILINSNPATIMTDPNVADHVYIEPLSTEYIEAIIKKDKPTKVVPTLGGQTALNLALELHQKGILEKYGVELLGATPEVIEAAEDREKFNAILDKVGAKYAKSYMVRTLKEGEEAIADLDFPVILRPNFTLGGGGGGVAYSLEEYRQKVANALHESPTSEVLVEQSLLGWKEFELEVMRDRLGTFVVICSIENIDPCGVHTGDSITVAPQQSLSDKAYQEMRDEAKKITEEVGVQTGGANIQFAVNPANGDRIVIEMNPRVSRSSALASKATGFPIAKIAAQLAVGATLDEITNDITGETPSCYEPALDYVVTKIPKFAFEKFHGSKDELSTQMKSVGEVMGIGRTFKESFGKAYRSLEVGSIFREDRIFFKDKISYPNSQRMTHIFQSLRAGISVDDLYHWTKITPWFLEQFKEMVDVEKELNSDLEKNYLKAKRFGFSDEDVKILLTKNHEKIKELSSKYKPTFFQVDTCAGEFASETPYLYSTFWSEVESGLKSQDKETVVVIGSGPNRIGQGIEFDYSCVRAVKKLRQMGYRVVMINSNPETVSTDYDTADVLFFEPLDKESILRIFDAVSPLGVLCQLGGQTPISLSKDISEAGYNIIGTPLDMIDLAEDRARFSKLCEKLDCKVPSSSVVVNYDEALEFASKAGYPVICRPSYVIGGRRMEIVEDKESLFKYFETNREVFGEGNPCFIDQFLEGGLEVDVDLIRFKDGCFIGGIVEHIEVAGVHSGDSMGVFPPQRLKKETQAEIERISVLLAENMGVLGLMNIQMAIKNDEIFIIEANPRASRTIPFIAKAMGVSLVDFAVEAMMGLKMPESLKSFRWDSIKTVAVKGVVFPFKKFPETDSILGPEMKSTGESMGRGENFPEALLKAFQGSDFKIPKEGEVFLSLREKDKKELLPVAQKLSELGFSLTGTKGTAEYFVEKGLDCEVVNKVLEGRPHCVDRIRSGKVNLVVNTTAGRQSINASYSIRRSCTDFSVPCLTESEAAKAYVLALTENKSGHVRVEPLTLTL